ncbi:MAG: electron transport complex subunit RsxG [Chromatiales bacterium]|jgi:electron transport complex protein RnfG
MKARLPVIIAALLLGMFAVIGSALVSFTYLSTADIIAENERQAILKKLYKLVPAESINNDIVSDTVRVSAPELLGAPETTVYLGRKDGEPVAAVFNTISPDGYSGPIVMLVAVMVDGSLGGVRIVSHRETPGLGDKVEEQKSDWVLQFDDKSLSNPARDKWKVKRDGGYFDQFTGATITPRTIVKAVKNTLLYYEKYGAALFEQNKAATGEHMAETAQDKSS